MKLDSSSTVNACTLDFFMLFFFIKASDLNEYAKVKNEEKIVEIACKKIKRKKEREFVDLCLCDC